MPLFALSGTIISSGFIIFLNLIALNFVWTHIHHETGSDIAEAQTPRCIKVEASNTTQTIEGSFIVRFDEPSFRITSFRNDQMGCTHEAYIPSLANVSPPTNGFVTFQNACDRCQLPSCPFLKSFRFRGPPSSSRS